MSSTEVPARVGFANPPYLTVYYWPLVNRAGELEIQCRARVQDGVCIVALDEETHEVYVVSVRRRDETKTVTCLELPGGGIEPGATPLETAIIELREEAGVGAVNDDDWLQLSPSEGWKPVDGLIWTSQHAYLLLRGRRIAEPTDNQAFDVSTMPLSKFLEIDEVNGFRDPLIPYFATKAFHWLSRHRPDWVT